MKNIIAIVLLAAITGTCKADCLQIYLPREISVNSDSPTLGQIAILRGNEALAAKAQMVQMGRISSAGQKITLDKSIILNSLACNGILASQVIFSGSTEVTISQKHQIIKGSEFVDKALEYLVENPPHASICKYNSLRAPDDLILPEVNETVKLTARLADKTNSQVKVLVSAFSGDNEIDSREVTFGLNYNRRRALAAIDMPAGTILSTQNVKIENFVSSQPEPANWAVPYGLAVKKDLSANSEIANGMVENIQPQIILKRNQSVLIKVEKMGLLVTAIGKTLEEGREGEYIKVQNLSSQRIIVAKVKQDGSVEPVF